MFLQNKLAILSFTLMSLMTIPTLAENDASPVTSRIENENFDVQIKTPEGWSETTDFSQTIPQSFKLDGVTYRGVQFKNGIENHGCAVFFAENDEDDDDDITTLENTLNQAQELAFGSKPPKVTFTKFSGDGSFSADILSNMAKIDFKGTLEGNLSKETGDPSKITISGVVRADSTKGPIAIGTGQIAVDETIPLQGTTVVSWDSDYDIIIFMWGTDETTQTKDALSFLEAVTVTERNPIETLIGVIVFLEPVVDEEATPVVSEPVVAVEQATPIVSETVVIVEEATSVVSETVAVVEEAAPVVSEPVVAVEEATPVVAETVAVVEEAAPAATETVAATEEVVQATPETPAA